MYTFQLQQLGGDLIISHGLAAVELACSKCIAPQGSSKPIFGGGAAEIEAKIWSKACVPYLDHKIKDTVDIVWKVEFHSISIVKVVKAPVMHSWSAPVHFSQPAFSWRADKQSQSQISQPSVAEFKRPWN